MAPQIRLDHARVEGVRGDTSACMSVQKSMTNCCTDIFNVIFVKAGRPSSRLARERLKRTLAQLALAVGLLFVVALLTVDVVQINGAPGVSHGGHRDNSCRC